MASYKGVVNWSEEIRKFIENKIKELERERVLEELEKFIQELPVMPEGSTVQYVREDRDSN